MERQVCEGDQQAVLSLLLHAQPRSLHMEEPKEQEEMEQNANRTRSKKATENDVEKEEGRKSDKEKRPEREELVSEASWHQEK